MSPETTALEEFLAPLKQAIESEHARHRLFGTIGWDVEALPQATVVEALEAVVTAAEDLAGFIEDPPDSLGEFLDALEAASTLVDAMAGLEEALDDTAGVPVEIYAAFGEDLFTLLVVGFLRTHHPVALQVATFLTLLRPATPATRPTLTLDDGTVVRYASPALDFDFGHVVDLLTDPVDTLKAEYGLTGSLDEPDLRERLTEEILPMLTALFYATGMPVEYGPGSTTEDLELPFADRGTDLGWVRVRFEAGEAEFSVRVHVLFDDADGVTLVVVPNGSTDVPMQVGRWAFTIAADSDGGALAIDTGGGSDAVTFDGADGHLNVSLTAVRLPDDSGAAFRVGGREGTRLEVGRLEVDGTADISSTQEYGVMARARESTFALEPGDGDSFLRKVFPEGMATDFDLGLGWSTSRGVHLEGSGALELELPLHVSLGEFLSMDGLSVGVLPGGTGETDPGTDGRRVPVYIGTTASAQLGPIAATIEGVGLEVSLSFPEDGDGNLGPIHADIGFKPPNGVGLAVDASAVVGGGYLYFDHEQQRYAGVLTLTVGSLTLNAVGLLTTQLPDGSDGFSLLIIITGEFPPLQLGFGFTLNAVGGLLGINRGARVDPLRAGVKDNSIKSVLFPDDPIRNAPTLISDLRRFFPPTPDQHVFGPMAELGWGTPTIVRAQLGLLLELPSPVRLLILGRIQAALPTPEAPLLLLQMNALGVINFDEGTASVDASLYDSRVVAYTLTGDMAMRTNWGDDPGFGLAVGGFHPKFQPPPEFPPLARVAVALASGDNPRLRMEGYFALTSNTVQVGAAVDAYAKAAGFSVSGHLGFDALFQFDPFRFLIDFAAHVRVRGMGLSLGLGLEGSLEGPSPWRVKGKAYIDLFLFSATVKVNATIGSAASSPGIPPAEVFTEFRAALSEPGNWSAQLPRGGDSLVTLREVAAEETQLLAHPLGDIEVVQRVVPLDVAIERYGNAEPADYDTFRVGDITVAGQTIDDERHELDAQFAPAQFFDMTNAEKLSAPSFERFAAGYRVSTGALAFGGKPTATNESLGDQIVEATLEYESVYVDEEENDVPFYTFISPRVVTALSEVSAVATSDARTTGSVKFTGGTSDAVSVEDTGYTVVTTDSFEHVSATGVDASGTTYTQAKQARDAYLAEIPDADVQVVTAHELAGADGGGS
ncbi:DUF6603 domain-containing protein [Salinigranum marinum]|uniref:DUF6603 domain-containing protein n=1 Tax=Salinigranum marinum TaxID=1515595 RepID=UPI002989BF3A|nr:DUF6603 domain-containing protein [Salinigranum marinum]